MENKNTQWVYYNGELYHAGVKGMQWGKHLPGTDWWKETTTKNMSSMPYVKSNKPGVALTRNTFGNKVRANLQTAGQAAKIYGRKINLASRIVGKQARAAVTRGAYKVAKGASNAWTNVKKGTSKLWNAGKGFSEQASARYKELAKKAYAYTRDAVIVYFNKSESRALDATQTSKDHNYLSKYVSSAWKKANEAYTKVLTSGKRMDMINSFIMSTGSNVVSGCTKFLDDIGLDDEVAKFLRKFK